MKLLMVLLLPVAVSRGDYLFSVLIVFSVALSMIPSLLERSYRVTLPFELDLLITLSIFLNTFMGEWLNFYQRVWLYDKALHVYGSAVVGLLAFVVVYSLNYTRKVRLSLPFIGLFTVTFAMAMGGIWEIGEFTVDTLFGKMTQNGLGDTMWDLINDLIGGIVTAVVGMVYVRYSNPDTRKRLAKPLGEVFGLGKRIDMIKERMERSRGTNRPAKRRGRQKAGPNAESNTEPNNTEIDERDGQ
ncbi:MAG: hypothetical protein A2V21_303445 [Deltaproteobacteria bacterium GWC2_55_46]|nr:MAG: hypothetical protein A3I81_07905 [Deltaproteobacteria bacterium RIFCSPLOWO2_02_FULL_55_12]OIJ73399.1 MAG: hypothetical protein A2V21_303445 [Deltaproteobacteria bacterium GWC2_55_46]